MLCGDDDDAAARAVKALVPDKAHGGAGRVSSRAGDTRGSDLMDSALMLRKLQAAALAATGEGARRARARLEAAGKALEHAGVLRFDEATARCDSAAPDSQEYASALVDMRAAADALLYYNGGATVMQRYVSTRKPFIDPDVILADRQAMEEVRSYPDALEKVERLIDDMLLFVQAEARRLPAVVSNPDAILLLLVERLCYERLAPMIEGVLDQAEAAAARDDHLAHDPAPSAAASNDRLECKVKVVRACLRFLASLKDPNRHMGASDGLGVPVADKDAGDDMAGMVADILAPYVHDFVEVQVDTLMERLAAYLPVVAPDDLVVYDLHGRQQAPGPLHRHDRLDRLDRHEADITPIADRDSTGMLPSRLSAAVSSQYADEEGRGAPGEEHAGKQREEHAGGGMQATRAASAASGEARSTSAALAWAARKRRDFSCTLPAPPTVWRWGGAKPAASEQKNGHAHAIPNTHVLKMIEK